MQDPERTEIIARQMGTEIPAAFARCEKIIGARFHSMVQALRMGISFLAHLLEKCKLWSVT